MKSVSIAIVVLASCLLECGAQIFSSVGELTKVFKMEEELVQVLRSQKGQFSISNSLDDDK